MNNDFITEALQKEVAKEALKKIDVKALADQLAKEYTKHLKASCKFSGKVSPAFSNEELVDFWSGFFESFDPYKLGSKAGKQASRELGPLDFIELITQKGENK